MAELADARDSKSRGAIHVGSIPTSGTNMKLFYDLLITLGIITTALPAVILLYHRHKTKNSFEYKFRSLSFFISLFLLFGTTVLVYGSFLEPRLLITNEQQINLAGIEEEIKIVFFADPQIGPYRREKHLEKIVEASLKLNPDMVLIGGDIINNGIPNTDETILLKPLKKLADSIPTYAIHGNHEYGVGSDNPEQEKKSLSPDRSYQVEKELKKLGIKYLVNDLELIEIGQVKFYLFGGDSLWADKLDFSSLKNREIKNIPTIALIHNPLSIKEAIKYNIDLVLSGHTHGGQIRFPFIGPLGRVDDTTPAELYQGLHEFGSTTLFVTSGIGETGTRARLFNPPEIVLITLK